ncbi:hypothetical protein HPB47_017742 [Ixodes persulcatus]|uniref:Uncharacterized protein n=1 Tax=Ixodes persulcatus TaxID=34615 RepID=A0AC60QPI7_IXOPE|nr:hypothetical protein HPB47_017742 [Ixodes persulcatus]
MEVFPGTKYLFRKLLAFKLKRSTDYYYCAMRFPEAHQIEERTHEIVLRDMKYAVAYETTVNGFKEPSPLINLENYDMFFGQACKSMHSVLLGVTKQLTEQLLGSSNSAERFYIVKKPYCLFAL